MKIRIPLACSLLLGIAGACAAPPKVGVTMSSPKMYSEDTTLRMLADRSRDFDEITGTITAAEINEIRGVREAKSTSIDVRAGRGGDNENPPEVLEPGDGAAPALPAAPTGDIGLSYDALMRRQFSRDQLRTAYELLYLGDQHLFDENRRVWLMRVDVSIDRYVDSGKNPKFLWVDFAVQARDSADVDVDPKEIKIYSLMPEYSSIAAQESWISNVLSNRSASFAYPVGSFDLQVGADSQSALEESLLQLLEQPLQFGLYGEESNRCSFAFGPRRKVVKRSWINPARWFGASHRVEYQIHPGTWPCMFIVSAPEVATHVRVAAGPRYEEATSADVQLESARKPRFEPREFTDEQFRSFTVDERADASVGLALQLAPAAGGALLVATPPANPVSSASRAFLQNQPVEITVLGRNWAEIRVAASANLEKWRKLQAKEGATVTANLRIFTPGIGASDHAVTLVEGEAPPKKPKWTVAPTKGLGPLEVALKPADASLLTAVTKVEVTKSGGMQEAPHFVDAASKSLVVSLPVPDTANKKAHVSFRIHYGSGGSDFLASSFQYDN